MLDSNRADDVAAAFGAGPGARLEGPVARGQQGQVWRLTTANGSLAVKEPFEPVSAAEAEADAAYQDLALAAGVPLPPVVRTVGGAVVADVGGTQLRAYGWVDVLPIDREGYDVAAVGRLVAAIHRVEVPASGPVDPWYAEPVGEGAWTALSERLGAAGAPFAAEVAALVPEILAAEGWVVPVEPMQVCHLDLWADNVRHTPSGGLVVLDWENAGPGDPSHELGPVLYDFGRGDPRRTSALYAAYVGAGGPGRLRGPEQLGMLVAQLNHILETGCESWLSSTTDADRQHNEDWVREYLSDPPTTRRLLGILAAVGA